MTIYTVATSSTTHQYQIFGTGAVRGEDNPLQVGHGNYRSREEADTAARNWIDTNYGSGSAIILAVLTIHV